MRGLRYSTRAFWLLALPTMLHAAEPATEQAKPVILLTGFEPFGPYAKNASWETARSFDGREIAGHRIVAVKLPVVYDAMGEPLQKAIEQHKPAIVISFGVGTPVVQVELTARNGYHPLLPKDNKGQPPPREKIAPEGAAEIPTQLPAEAIVKALQAARIGAWKSQDAGGYLCNECFYRLLSTQLKDHKFAARGFVHVPDFGSQDPAGGEYTPEKLRQAAQIIIETTVKAGAAVVEKK